MSIASTWGQIKKEAEGLQLGNTKGFQGALYATQQLGSLFIKRFITPIVQQQNASPIMPALISFIFAIVSQWADSTQSQKFSLSNPHIPKAKKLFFYNLLLHRKQTLE